MKRAERNDGADVAVDAAHYETAQAETGQFERGHVHAGHLEQCPTSAYREANHESGHDAECNYVQCLGGRSGSTTCVRQSSPAVYRSSTFLSAHRRSDGAIETLGAAISSAMFGASSLALLEVERARGVSTDMNAALFDPVRNQTMTLDGEPGTLLTPGYPPANKLRVTPMCGPVSCAQYPR